MANKYGYSGHLGYNSLRVSRSQTCCCPTRGERGPAGKDATQIQHGLFIYADATVSTNGSPHTMTMSEINTTNFGDANLNFINQQSLNNTSKISFSDLSANYPNGAIVEFHVNSDIDANTGGVNFTFDLHTTTVEGSSKGTIEIDTRSTGISTIIKNIAFGPVIYRLDNTGNANTIHFSNVYDLRVNATNNADQTYNNTRLTIKVRSANS